MQKAVLKLQELGAPPEGYEDKGPHDDDTIEFWDEWIDAVEFLQTPITWDEAEILIKCCPTDPMAEVEWSILHCIESVPHKTEGLERYRNLVEQCNSDMMKEMLLERLDSLINSKKQLFPD